jgi:hypothetical protein
MTVAALRPLFERAVAVEVERVRDRPVVAPRNAIGCDAGTIARGERHL